MPSVNKKLIAAADNGDEKGIIKALQRGADVNFREPSKLDTALIRATQFGHLNAVEVLLNNNALICVKTKDGWTALHFAAFCGHEKIVEAMIKHGGDVDVRNRDEETPIILAALYGQVEAVKVLLQNGARADCCDWRGKSALACATDSRGGSKKEKDQCVEMLKDALLGSRYLTSKHRSQTKKDQGNAAFRKGDYKRAAILYTDAINEFQSNYLFYSNRSAAFFELGEYMYAKEDAIKCLGLNPQFAKGYLRISMACMALDEYELVVRETKKGLNQSPSEDLTNKLLELQKEAAVARKNRDTISEDIVVGNVTGFPASNSLHPSRDPIFASGEDQDGLIKAWVTLIGQKDASVRDDKIHLMVLLYNLDEEVLVIDNNDEKSFLVNLRNKSTQSSINTECKEIDGESVEGENLKTVRLRQGQWAVFSFFVIIPAGMELYESEALKKCHDLQINFKQSDIQDDLVCNFDLSYIRNYYDGFRPGLVCSTYDHSSPDPLHPTWLKGEACSGKEKESADYDDEKYMDGFALLVKDLNSSMNGTEHVHRVQITSPPKRNELVSTIEKSFHGNKTLENRPCVLQLSISGGAVVNSDEALKSIKDFMKFEVCFVSAGCCWCRKPEMLEKFSRCGKCKKARYCSRHCQANDWPRHKSLCLEKTKIK